MSDAAPGGFARALGDLLVLDLTTEFCSGVATGFLADFGALVVRVEELPAARERRARARDADPEAGWDFLGELAHRNKRSLAVDLEAAPGAEILRGLLRRADALVTDWPRARLEERGLAYRDLSGARPDLVYARASGFGPKGPDRDLPALDELAAARTGMMPILPQPGAPPVYAAAGPMYTAALLAFGVLAALHHRAETGTGQEVDASLLAGNMYGASLDLQAYLAMGGERFLRPLARLDAGNPMSGVLYRASDGRWVCLTMPETDRWWPGLAGLAGLDPADPRFDSHEKRCGASRLELIRVLEDVFRRRPASEWKAELDARRLSADVVEEFAFPAEDPQARRNRYVLALDHPSRGPIKTLGFPIFLSEAAARLRSPAPALGQHSAQLLHELLGFPEARIAELAASGVIESA